MSSSVLRAKVKELLAYAIVLSKPDLYALAENSLSSLIALEAEINTRSFSSRGSALETGPGSGLLDAFFRREFEILGANSVF